MDLYIKLLSVLAALMEASIDVLLDIYILLDTDKLLNTFPLLVLFVVLLCVNFKVAVQSCDMTTASG